MTMTAALQTDRAFAIRLPVWQAPNDHVQMTFVRDALRAEFPTWTKNANYSKYNGVLDFSCVWGLRLERNKHIHYYANREEDEFVSVYWVVPESSWLENLIKQRDLASPGWRKHDRSDYKHYIIQSNDHYVEIIAGDVHFSKRRPNSGQ